MTDDHPGRADNSVRSLLTSCFDLADFATQLDAVDSLDDQERADPGFRQWLRDRILSVLRDDSTPIEDRLHEWTGQSFDGGPQIAWDFWAYVWETVTGGEPWPADLPPANADTFASLREEYNEAEDE